MINRQRLLLSLTSLLSLMAQGQVVRNDTVTDIYINFDMKKVDDANRKVIDYVIGRL